MTLRRQTVADVLFALQIVGAFVFCGAHFMRSLSDVAGVCVAQIGLVAAYLVFHLLLGIAAHAAKPSRLSRQAIATYAIWLGNITLILIAIGINGSYRWSAQDSTTLAIAVVMTIMVIGLGRFGRRGISDPLVRALLAIAYKSVPQLLLAWKIMDEGGSGLPGLSVLVGHMTILIRIGQVYFMVMEAGWDRNRTWLAVSETANELSWLVATIAWFIA